MKRKAWCPVRIKCNRKEIAHVHMNRNGVKRK